MKLENHAGEKTTAKNGQVMTIIRYGTNRDIDVQFEDGTIVCNRRYDAFRKGLIGYDKCHKMLSDYPELAAEFSPANEEKPEKIHAGSQKERYLWKCSKCGYEWRTTVKCRVYLKT